MGEKREEGRGKIMTIYRQREERERVYRQSAALSAGKSKEGAENITVFSARIGREGRSTG